MSSNQGSLSSQFQDVLGQLKSVADNRTRLDDLKAMLADNIGKEQAIMSAITDWAAKESADLTTISTTLDGVVTGIAALDALITNFQDSTGTLSAADQAALDGIQAASKVLVTKSAGISVAPPTPPPPPATS